MLFYYQPLSSSCTLNAFVSNMFMLLSVYVKNKGFSIHSLWLYLPQSIFFILPFDQSRWGNIFQRSLNIYDLRVTEIEQVCFPISACCLQTKPNILITRNKVTLLIFHFNFLSFLCSLTPTRDCTCVMGPWLKERLRPER